MAFSTENIFITYVDVDHDLLKIWGQHDRTCATYIEKQLLQLVPEFNASTGPNPNCITKGMFCFAKYADDNYYRARIISDIQRNGVGVFFVDYGNRDFIDISNIRVLDSSDGNVMSKILPQAEEFTLAGVIAPSGGWTKEMIAEIRRDLTYYEFKFRMVCRVGNERMIQINFHNDDYSQVLIHRKIAREIPLEHQRNYIVNFLAQSAKPKPSKTPQNLINQNVNPNFSNVNYNYQMVQNEQMGQISMKNSNEISRKVQQLAQKIHSKQSESLNALGQLQNTFPGSSAKVGLPGQNPETIVSQNTVYKQNNHIQPPDGVNEQMLNPLSNVVIKALAVQLKQQLMKDTPNMNSDPFPHSYFTEVLEVGTTHNVYVSYIQDGPWAFSVQLVSSENELNKLMDELAAVELVPIKLPILLGYPCIAKSQQYENNCRGVVVNVSHSAVRVYFVDFGNTEDLPVSMIFELPVRFFKTKVLSQKFALSGLQKIKSSKELKQAFVEVVENELLLLQVTNLEGDNLPTCELYLKDRNIKRLLNDKVRQVIQWEPIEFPRQGEIETVIVTWIESPQKFFVQLKRNDAELASLKLELAALGMKGERFKNEELLPGALCVCCYSEDNEWYRAVITSVNSKDSVTVFYVDYGNTETANINMLRKIGGNGLVRQLNTQAIQCCLIGFEEQQKNQEKSNETVTTLLTDLLMEKDLHMRVLSSEKDYVVVQMFENDRDISKMLFPRKSPLQTISGGPGEGVGMFDSHSVHIQKEVDGRRRDLERHATNKKKELGMKIEEMGQGDTLDKERESDKVWRSISHFESTNMDMKRGDSCGDSLDSSDKHSSRSHRDKDLSWRIREHNDDRSSRKWSKKYGFGSRNNEKSTRSSSKNYGSSPGKSDDSFEDGCVRKDSKSEKMWRDTNESAPNTRPRAISKKQDFRDGENSRNFDSISKNPSTKNYPGRKNEIEHGVNSARFDSTSSSRKKFGSDEDGFKKGKKTDNMWNNSEVLKTGRKRGGKFDKGDDDTSTSSSIGWRFKKAAMENALRGVAIEQFKEIVPQPVAQENIAPPNSVFKQKYVRIGSLEEVIVTFYLNPGEIYVQLLPANKDFREMMNDIQLYYSTKSPLTGNIKKGDLVVSMFKDDGVLYRAVVRETSPITVHYVDYGNEEVTEMENLWPLDKKYLDLESQSIRCCISNLKPIGSNSWPPPDENIDKIFECEKYTCQFLDIKDNVYEIELKVAETGKDVCDELISHGCGVRVDTCKDTVLTPRMDLDLLCNESYNVYISHIVDPSEFYVQLDSGLVQSIEEEIEKYINVQEALPRLSAAAAEENVLCLIKTPEDFWVRGKIIKKTDVECVVQYVDYGNKVQFTDEEVLRSKHLFSVMILPNGLAKYENQALQCSLLSDVIPNVAADEFRDYDNKTLVAFVHEYDGERLKLTLRNFEGRKLDFAKDSKDEETRVISISSAPIYHQGIKIYVACFVSLREIYLQRISDMVFLENFSSELTRFYNEGGEKFEVKDKDLIGKLCAAKSNADGCWYRARITNSGDNDLVTVFFIDYGNSEDLSFEDIRKLDSTFHEQYTFAKKVSLNLILEDNLEQDVNRKLSDLILEKEMFGYFIKRGDEIIAELLEDNRLITDFLISDKIQKCCSGFDYLVPKNVEKAKSAEEVSDSNVFISHVVNPNKFWVHQESVSNDFDSFRQVLQDYCSGATTKADLHPDQVVGVRYSDEWYRAKIIEVNGDMLSVEFIDYGNVISVKNSDDDVKELSEDIRSVPLFSRFCSLRGSWKEDSPARFEEIITTHQDPFTLVELETGNPVVVDLLQNGKSVTLQLIKEGFAEQKELKSSNHEIVHITHVNSPNDFYVQKLTDKPIFDKISSGLIEADSFPATQETFLNKIYCARYPEDGFWHRGRLISKGSNETKVHFIDFGYTSVVTDLRELPDDLKDVPDLTQNCCLLYGKENDAWSESACEKFMEYLGVDLEMKIVVQGVQKYVVQLFTESGENMTEILEELCVKDARSEVCVTHVKSPNDFYVRRADDKNYDVVKERLKAAEEWEELAKGTEGLLCVAKSNDCWMRVKIRKVHDDGYEVFNIDSGTIFKTATVKEMPEDLAAIPGAVKNCSLNFSVTNIPESVKEEFINLTNGGSSVFRCAIVKPGEKDVVSLILDGKKLEEVLLYAISDKSEIYNLNIDGSFVAPNSNSVNYPPNEQIRERLQVINETDEEKRFKFAIITSDNMEGFKSDDEKQVVDASAYSNTVNVPDNQLIEESTRTDEESDVDAGAAKNDIDSTEVISLDEKRESEIGLVCQEEAEQKKESFLGDEELNAETDEYLTEEVVTGNKSEEEPSRDECN